MDSVDSVDFFGMFFFDWLLSCSFLFWKFRQKKWQGNPVEIFEKKKQNPNISMQKHVHWPVFWGLLKS